MKKYFYAEESAVSGRMLIKANLELLPVHSIIGSYTILCARLMELSFPQFLRMCRDIYGAEIVGRGHMYPAVYFERGKKLDTLLTVLNKKAQWVIEMNK